MDISVIALIFVLGAVTILILAICNVGKPSHDRYLELMLYWPYVFAAPFVIIMRRALPGRYFGYDGQHRPRLSRTKETADGSSEPAAITWEEIRDALRVAVDRLSETETSKQLEFYRKAFRLLMDRLGSAQWQSELLEWLREGEHGPRADAG